MPIFRCPGQDTRFWKPEDIFESPCPYCDRPIEFWKDEPRQRCRGCGKTVTNPKLDMGCAKWCKYAEECVGKTREGLRQFIENTFRTKAGHALAMKRFLSGGPGGKRE